MTTGNVSISGANRAIDSEAFRLYRDTGRRLTLLGMWILTILGFAVASQAVVATILVGRVPWLVTSGHLTLTSGAAVTIVLRLPKILNAIAEVEARHNEQLALLWPNDRKVFVDRTVTMTRRKRVQRQRLV